MCVCVAAIGLLSTLPATTCHPPSLTTLVIHSIPLRIPQRINCCVLWLCTLLMCCVFWVCTLLMCCVLWLCTLLMCCVLWLCTLLPLAVCPQGACVGLNYRKTFSCVHLALSTFVSCHVLCTPLRFTPTLRTAGISVREQPDYKHWFPTLSLFSDSSINTLCCRHIVHERFRPFLHT